MRCFALVVSAAAIPWALGINECADKTTCAECLEDGLHSFCGWCSPGGILYANGSTGARCGDERDDPWDCPQHYQTRSCPLEYTCNKTSWTCVISPPGTPGATTNMSGCAAHCTKPPPPPPPHNHTPHNSSNHTKHYYQCDNSSQICEQVTTNGSGTFPTIASCNATCSKPHKKHTPDALLGLWRGIMVSKNFTMGEYDFLFLDGGNVTITTPTTTYNASCTSYVSPKDPDLPQIWLTFVDGPDAGKVRKAIYKVGPSGPETNTTVLGFGPLFPSEDLAMPPSGWPSAMVGGPNDVFFLRSCLPDPGLNCLWAGEPDELRELKVERASPFDGSEPLPIAHSAKVVQQEADPVPAARRVQVAPGVDPCNEKTNCSTCTADHGGHQCGWCTAPVTYGNGTSLGGGDVHCAGFNADGSTTGFPWQCDGLYVRGTCFDHICEVYANYTVNCRHTHPGEVGTINKDQCATKCIPPAKVYSCNHTVGKCQVIAPGHAGGMAQSVCAKNCTKPPPPPPKPPPMVMCNNDTLKCEKVNSTTKGGQTGAACAAACIKKYLCAPNGNQSNLTCKEIGRSEPAYPSAQTLSACQSTCVEPPKHNGTPPVLQGTYRGIMISGDGTPHGEWDLKLGPDYAELKNQTGVVWKAKVETGGMSPMTFILGNQGPTSSLRASSGSSAPVTNGTIHALYTFENGPVTTRFTLAMSAPNGKAPKNWGDVMMDTTGGLVLGLVKCLDDKPQPPIPGGTYCDPNSVPPQMCPPFNGNPSTKCPKCSHPPCLCPGNYPPPPPLPPGQIDCNFAAAFSPGATAASNTEER